MIYRPIAYFNDVESLRELQHLSADEIVREHLNDSTIHRIQRPDDESELDTEEEEIDNTFCFTEDRKYLVIKQEGNFDEEDDENCGIFYDIYEVAENIVYAVDSVFYNGDDSDFQYEIFSDYADAKEYFNRAKKSFYKRLEKIAGGFDIVVEVDNGKSFRADFNEYDGYVDANIVIKVVR